MPYPAGTHLPATRSPSAGINRHNLSSTRPANFEQGNIAVGAFGPATAKTVEDEGLRLDLEAPNKAFPSMTGALADYLKRHNK